MRDEKQKLDRIATQYNLAKAYESITKSEGFKVVEEDIRSYCESVGKYAVYPGYKECEHDRLVEARGWLKLLDKITFESKKVANLKNQLSRLDIDVA